jgi:hypothetical protein
LPLHQAKYLAPRPLGVKMRFGSFCPFGFFCPEKCRFEIFEQKMVTDKKGFKNYTTVDPKQWVDSRSALRNWVKHMK